VVIVLLASIKVLGEAAMQQISMSLCLLGFTGALLDRHPVAARVVLLGAIFIVGYAEASILKSRGVASVTWFLGLAAASIWVAYPVTPIRVAAGLAVFLCGVVALIIFYRKKPKEVSRVSR